MIFPIEHELMRSLFDIFPKVKSHTIPGVEYKNEFKLNFHISDPRYPLLEFSKYGDTAKLIPYYPPLANELVSLDDVRKIACIFLDFVNDPSQESPYERLRTNGWSGALIRYISPNNGLQYDVSMHHPRGWCIDVLFANETYTIVKEL